MVSTRKLLREMESLTKASPATRHQRGLFWVKQGIGMVKAETLAKLIHANASLIPVFSNHFKLTNPVVRPLAVLVLRTYWEEIEPFLTDANAVREAIAVTPAKRTLLATPEGIRWLNAAVYNCYNWFYDYVWGCESCD